MEYVRTYVRTQAHTDVRTHVLWESEAGRDRAEEQIFEPDMQRHSSRYVRTYVVELHGRSVAGRAGVDLASGVHGRSVCMGGMWHGKNVGMG